MAMDVRGGGDVDKPGLPQQLWRSYLQQLDARPLYTKAATSTVISTIGDVLSQWLTLKAKHMPFVWDAQRTGLYVIVGVLMGSIVVHYWYDFLETKVAPADKVKGKWERVFRQLLVDQTVGCTLINAGFYILHTALVALVGGRFFPLGALFVVIRDKLAREMWPMLLNNWKLWPAANLINFSMVPPQLRVLFANFVAIFWSAYMSGSANR